MNQKTTILDLVRPNIATLKPYSSARHEFEGVGNIHLDANENPYDTGFNRYPDPHHMKIRNQLASLKSCGVENIFLGNGSDEIIDLIIRIFCEPGQDQIMITDPTYGMYRVCADLSNISVQTVSLKQNFQLDTDRMLPLLKKGVKILFLCSPNNPTGNLMGKEDIKFLLERFSGIVVVDEAYIDFSHHESILPWLSDYSNLVVMQTFSKAWGLAGIRLGMAFSSPQVIDLLYKVKPPYNVNSQTQHHALKALMNHRLKEEWVKKILADKEKLINHLNKLDFVKLVYPSDANFVLVKMNDANAVYDYLKAAGIVVRNRSNVHLCDNCLRITVGTRSENTELLETLNLFQSHV